jgi:hypothetical protein
LGAPVIATNGTSYNLAYNNGNNWAFASQAQGDIPYASSTTAYARLGLGAGYSLLRTNAGATAPEYSAVTINDSAANAFTIAHGTSSIIVGAGGYLTIPAGAQPTTPPGTTTLAANDGSNLTLSGQAAGDLAVASSTTAYGKLADVAVGSTLMSGGVGAAPVYCGSLIDGSAGGSPSVASLRCGPQITNYGQSGASENVSLPAEAAGLSFLASVGTAPGSYYWRFTSYTSGAITLDGVSGKNYAEFATPAVGNFLACFTQQTGASTFIWICKTGNGTSSTN